MDAARELSAARTRAGLSQRALATRAGTSQAAVSAYESGRRQPSVAVLDRLLAATGSELTVVADPKKYSASDLERSGRHLAEVLALAEALPFRREEGLRYPRLPAADRG